MADSERFFDRSPNTTETIRVEAGVQNIYSSKPDGQRPRPWSHELARGSATCAEVSPKFGFLFNIAPSAASFAARASRYVLSNDLNVLASGSLPVQ